MAQRSGRHSRTSAGRPSRAATAWASPRSVARAAARSESGGQKWKLASTGADREMLEVTGRETVPRKLRPTRTSGGMGSARDRRACVRLCGGRLPVLGASLSLSLPLQKPPATPPPLLSRFLAPFIRPSLHVCARGESVIRACCIKLWVLGGGYSQTSTSARNKFCFGGQRRGGGCHLSSNAGRRSTAHPPARPPKTSPRAGPTECGPRQGPGRRPALRPGQGRWRPGRSRGGGRGAARRGTPCSRRATACRAAALAGRGSESGQAKRWEERESMGAASLPDGEGAFKFVGGTRVAKGACCRNGRRVTRRAGTGWARGTFEAPSGTPQRTRRRRNRRAGRRWGPGGRSGEFPNGRHVTTTPPCRSRRASRGRQPQRGTGGSRSPATGGVSDSDRL
jgi:hypothetical protein